MTRIFVRREGAETGGCPIVFEAGKNLLTGEGQFKKAFGTITSLEGDLLFLASAIFAADRCTERGERENVTRRIELLVPIVNIGRLQPFAQKIEQVLRALSNDSWRLVLRQQDGKQEKPLSISASPGKTLLFSGGLDSLAAAIEFGRPGNDPLQLVSHITRNQQTINAQRDLAALLAQQGAGYSHRQFVVTSRAVSPTPALEHDVESSQRTRSFLFLVLAALCARRVGHRDILMIAENGQMAIHLPLTHGRIGAFSTHTAHPDVIAKIQGVLQGTLCTPLRIINPYVGRTKAEVIKVIWDLLPQSIPLSISCWRSSRLPAQATHCGCCIPCIIRRIAVEFHGADPTAYARDPWTENFGQLPPDDDARRNLADWAEFAVRVEQLAEAELMVEWPELYSSNIDARSAISMYKRAAAETRTVWGRYPQLSSLLQ